MAASSRSRKKGNAAWSWCIPTRRTSRSRKRLQVFMPKLEQEHPERNDKLLKELADGTGGQMYVGMPAAIGPQSDKPLVGAVRR